MSLALGGYALGTEPLAGDPLWDPPSVTVNTIGTISAGGPSLPISWVYSQPQGKAQEWYRVEILNDALSTLYYDTGFLDGANSSTVVDVDAAGVPHESTDVTARVSVRGPEAIGAGTVARWEASDTDPYVIQFGVPHATILTPPDETVQVTVEGVAVTWSFADDRGALTQGAYRVRLLLTASQLVVYDSGWTDGAGTSHNIPTQLSDGSRYTVEVQLKNTMGIRSD